jgi:PilZ domain
MQAATSPARQARSRHRHDLRVLTYVTLDEGNGGIVRNLNDEGIAVQAVAALRPRQKVRVLFELRNPKLRVEAPGEVMWANSSGQCGIRFLDLAPRAVREINAWILGDLLACAEDVPWLLESRPDASAFAHHEAVGTTPAPRGIIRLEPLDGEFTTPGGALHPVDPVPRSDWLSQPLSGQSLAWTVDALTVLAALLLFSLVFLSVTHELPKWPLAVATAAAIFVSGFYWAFFQLFGGRRFGERLARMVAWDEDEEALEMDRFR